MLDAARIRPGTRSGMTNAGWAYDSHPYLPRFLPGQEMELAYLRGPGVITSLHIGRPGFRDVAKDQWPRGMVLLVYYNDHPQPAVQVPYTDFFGDGCNARAQHFSSHYVEKAPEAYNGWFPMPFEKSIRIVLRNDLDCELMMYTFVEYEMLPEWDPSLGYFHATWKRDAFQPTGESLVPMFHVRGQGHLIGRQWSISTDEEMFTDFRWLCEANNEVRIDGQQDAPPPGPYEKGRGPAYDYLGSEDSFGFAWGFPKVFCGPWNGITFLQRREAGKSQLMSVYRFHGTNPIRFSKSLDWSLNWVREGLGQAYRPEFREPALKVRSDVAERAQQNGAWADYATVFYWYQSHVGYAHADLGPVERRAAELIRA